jgi:signal transduction histidine kinase
LSGFLLIPRTLRGRLVLASLGAIVAAVCIFAVAAVLLVRRDLRGSLDTALRQRAQAVAQLAVSAPAVLGEPGALEGPVSGRQIAVEVVDAHGRILARSLTLGAELLPLGGVAHAALVSGSAGFDQVQLGGRPFRLYAAPIADAGGPAAGGAVLVASDTTDIAHTVRHLWVVLALSGVGAALVAAFAAAAMTRRGLRPLQRLAAGAREIERTGDPARRLPASELASAEDTRPAADEIAQLTGVLNRMLDSLQRSRNAERRFLADASHELRTPVTALLGNVEYAARHGADAEVLADLRRDATRLARLVDDLLALERQRATDSDFAPLRLDQLAADAVVAAGGPRVRAELPEPTWVRGDADALRRALDNLIENALVHGQGVVRVEVRRDPGNVALITVRDDGPGPPPADRERLFERFWRGRDASERPGSGLGLSIVAATAARHGGAVEVDGSTFTVRLPAAPPDQANSHVPLKQS